MIRFGVNFRLMTTIARKVRAARASTIIDAALNLSFTIRVE
jgi:hypothetical protein